MLVEERQARLLDRVNTDGKVESSQLSAEFGTSEDTIRRDLRELAARGLCRRVYGGAVRISPASAPREVRSKEDLSRKDALGEALAGLAQPGQFVFVDAGTTNLAAAKALPVGIGLVVATHDPAIAAALASREDIELIVVGGRVDPSVGAALGVETVRAIGQMRPDLLLLGACALDSEAGCAVFHAEDAAVKRLLVERARSVATALLSEKLGTTAPFSIGGVDILDDLVVESQAPADALEALSARSGLRLHRCGAAESR
jgi:DeoR/GlpR family transcriptional regulator of sugar metabolism